ncbi:chromosome transmission fidelity protein 8 homolog [Zophobas morio]|uniref:chromosome transmission fidelity protein 8 homolog n=1 Tax=Zophobas morio TaxID=2755281 RepID=UPI003082E74D
MPIFVKVPSEGLSPDWAIVELQGDLKSHSQSPFDGQFIGDLHFTKSGTPVLIIGHHLMFGKEMKMEKPLALLEKKTDTGVAYHIKTIITKKLIFKTRPKPIVSN